MIAKNNVIAIVWAPHESRTAQFAQRLKAPLFNIHYLQYKRPLVAPIKYIAQWLKTWRVLSQQRPRFVYITNPPVFATLCVAMYCRAAGAKYIMDTHSPALYSRKWAWTVPLQRLLAKSAWVNVVDQQRYQALFESWGGRALVLENPPKDAPFGSLTEGAKTDFFDVAVVNTFAADEPVDIILDAARQLPNVRFFIMGNKAMAQPGLIESAPSNAIFTDYLLKDAYWNQLHNARAVMVLTTYPYSLLGGAQDGVILRKPLILSNQPALVEYFTKGTVFIENTAVGIVEGVKQTQAKEAQLIQEIVQLGEEHNQHWEQNFQKLANLIEAPQSGST